jgi:hypothetical protein
MRSSPGYQLANGDAPRQELFRIEIRPSLNQQLKQQQIERFFSEKEAISFMSFIRGDGAELGTLFPVVLDDLVPSIIFAGWSMHSWML